MDLLHFPNKPGRLPEIKPLSVSMCQDDMMSRMLTKPILNSQMRLSASRIW